MQYRVFATLTKSKSSEVTIDLGPAPEDRDTFFRLRGLSDEDGRRLLKPEEMVYNNADGVIEQCVNAILAALMDYNKQGVTTSEQAFEARQALSDEITSQLEAAVDAGRAFAIAAVSENENTKVYMENV